MDKLALTSAWDELGGLLEDFDELDLEVQIVIAESVIKTIRNAIEEADNGEG